MLKKVHHTCFVVNNLDETIAKMEGKYHLRGYTRILIEDRKMEAVLFELENGYIELLAPVDEESDLSEYISEYGEGFHHIAYEVDRIGKFIEAVGNMAVKKVRISSVGNWKVADLVDSYFPEVKVQIVEVK